MQLLEKIKIVLVEPSHPGNIGAVARAMKTMGFHNLVLINPRKFPHYEATKLAAGAESVLEQVCVLDSLEEAIKDCTLIMGTSVREREVSWPTANPKKAAKRAWKYAEKDAAENIAILFGRENSGLKNHELDLCQLQICIPANNEYSSLNLASAVQIIAYEIRMHALAQENKATETQTSSPTMEKGSSARASKLATNKKQQLASHQQRQDHLTHLLETLDEIDFIRSGPPTMLIRKLTRLYNKAELATEEIQILRGILTAVQNKIRAEK